MKRHDLAWTTLLLLAHTPFCHPSKGERVNLQWSICDDAGGPAAVLTKLGPDPDAAELPPPYKATPVTYYDLPDRPFYLDRGLMFRVQTRRGRALSKVKAHFADDHVTDDDDDGVLGGARCMWTRYGNDTQYACDVQAPLKGESHQGRRRRLWTSAQMRFAEHVVPDVEWDRLVPYGPFPNPKWRVVIEGVDAVLDDVPVAFSAGGGGTTHLMELEAKPRAEDGEGVYRLVTEFLERRGVGLCARQESKTRRLFQSLGYYDEDGGEGGGMGELR